MHILAQMESIINHSLNERDQKSPTIVTGVSAVAHSLVIGFQHIQILFLSLAHTINVQLIMMTRSK